jgi:hypothetical protein
MKEFPGARPAGACGRVEFALQVAGERVRSSFTCAARIGSETSTGCEGSYGLVDAQPHKASVAAPASAAAERASARAMVIASSRCGMFEAGHPLTTA